MLLPKKIEKPKVPPLKIQGIKTKLIPFILENIKWDGNGTYIEPFMGSGSVGFNIAPDKAIFNDINPHIIELYNSIKDGNIEHKIIKDYLEAEGAKLEKTPPGPESYFYEVRERFNKDKSVLDFLFLQRANFNGMIRFNPKGDYNVSFCNKPKRFSKALITKITNQVKWVEELMKDKDWEFTCKDFTEVMSLAKKGDLIYLDPPYFGLNDTYYTKWDKELADKMIDLMLTTEAEVAYSIWYEKPWGKNENIKDWPGFTILTTDHSYQLASKAEFRNAVTEALIVKNSALV